MTTIAALILALSSPESGNNDRLRGGRFQWTETAWMEHTNMDYKFAMQRAVAERVTKRKLVWDAKNFKKATGREIDAASRYACWHIGFAGYRKYGFDQAKLPPEIRDRCSRFQNLVEDLERQK